MDSDIGVPPGHDALRLEHVVGDPRTQLGEALGDAVFAVVMADEIHETPTPGSGDLPSDGAVRDGGIVEPVDHGVGDLVGELLLVLPGEVQELPGELDVALLQCSRHIHGDLLGPVEGLLVLAGVEGVHLALDDLGRLPGGAGVAQEGAELELVERVLGDPDLHDVHAIFVELHQVEPAEHGGVLVLLPALEPDLLALQLVGQLGHLVAGHLDAEPLAGGGDDGDYDGGGPSQPGARRGLRLEEHLETVGDLEVVGDRLDEVHIAVQRQRATVQGGLELAVVRGVHRHGPVARRRDRAVGVPVDGGVEHSTALLRRVRVDIGPAAGNPYP
jgi:hypothetical protein